MNFDAGFSSFFAFKPAGESKIYFGPVWDMDNAFASPYVQFDVPLTTTELWWANQMAYNGIPSILAAACRHEDFRALVREKWAALQEDGAFEAVQARIAALADSLQKSGGMNGVRWNFYDTADYETAAARWQEEAALCMAFTEARIETLDTGFSEEGAYLYYDMNGASDGRWASVSPIRRIGDTVTVRSITENGNVVPPEGRLFHSWNTEPDGSGDKYLPGDELVLAGEETVLYAVWKTQYEINKENGVNPFEDVPEGKYYTAAVLWAYYHEPQITSGADETHFAPNAPCTREQVMTFLYAAADRPGHQQSESPFTDVKPGKYYYNPVLWAVEKGITGGVGGGLFGVGVSCTREQVMTFLWAAAGRPLPENGETPFSDVEPGAYYAKAVAWAVEQKLTGGVGDGRFGVGEPCTRGQVVSFLYSTYGKGE